MRTGLVPFLIVAQAGCGSPVLDGPCEVEHRSQEVYNTFWATLDRHYAVFEERLGGDWEALGRARCADLGPGTPSDGLYDAMIGLARELDDGHTTINGAGRSEDGWVTAYPHDDQLQELEFIVEAAYLDDELTWAANRWVAWGRIGDIGYLSLTSMDGLSLLGSETSDESKVYRVMAEVLEDLGDTDALLVDVRANEGGWDVVSLAFARHFAGPRTVAWSEQRRRGPDHDDVGPWRDFFVEADDNGYDKPVGLLVSGGSFSAAETFVLAMVVRDDVTVLGEPTSGHFSDLFSDRLPNGWTFTYSGERYRAADGVVYEGVGYPPDVEIPLDPDAVDVGLDPMFERALAWIQNRARVAQ